MKQIIRSSCPILNYLADSNIINYDGKNLSAYQLSKSIGKFFNINNILLFPIILVAMILNDISIFKNFNLKDISKHNYLEHDASLFIDDFYFTGYKNYHIINNNHLNDLIKLSKDKKNITLEEIKIHKKRRIDNSKKNNPTFKFGIKAKILSYIETYLLLNVVGKNNSISIADLKKFIEKKNK